MERKIGSQLKHHTSLQHGLQRLSHLRNGLYQLREHQAADRAFRCENKIHDWDVCRNDLGDSKPANLRKMTQFGRTSA